MSVEKPEIPDAMKTVYNGQRGLDKVLRGTNKAVRSAIAAGALTEHDSGAVEIARALSRKIDRLAAMEELQLKAIVDGEDVPVVPVDNTVIPTLLKVYEHLGLTPRSRAYINSINPAGHLRGVGGKQQSGEKGSKFAKFNRGAGS